MSEPVDVIADVDGDEIEVRFCEMRQLPVLVARSGRVDLDDAGAERFSRAWNEALLRRDRARGQDAPASGAPGNP